MKITKDIDQAIRLYLGVICDYRYETDSYSSVEIAKCRIADALLVSLEYPTSPSEPRTTKRAVEGPFYRSVSFSNRLTVFRRDNYQCVMCKTEKDLTIDHVIPKSKGGTNEPENLQVLCRRCNAIKGNRTPLSRCP